MKRYYARRKPKRFTKRRSGVGKRKLKKTLKQVMLSEAELKYRDTQINSTFSTAVGSLWYQEDIAQIPRGDGDSQRVGDKITPTSIEMRYTIDKADTYNIVRVILLRCLDYRSGISANAPFTPSEIFQHNTTPTDALHSPFTNDLRKLYNVLYDSGAVILSTNRNDGLVTYKKNIRLSPYPINYVGSNTANGHGRLILIFLSDSNVTTHPAVEGWVRLHYRDI